MMKVDYDVSMEIAGHEAMIRQAYKDSEGVWTWSVGLTSATGHRVERYIGKPQSLEHCLRVYVWALDNYADEVRKVFKGMELTKAQFAAALSFHWNTGGIGRATWVKHFKAGKMAEAERAFMSWRKPPEIVGRRKKEADLLFRGVWSNNGTMTEYTRLTKNSTPDWGSARKINVEKELRAALAGEIPESDKVIVEKPTVPPKVETEVKKKTNFWQMLMGLIGSGGLGLGWLGGLDWTAIVAGGGVMLVFAIALLLLRHQLIAAVKDVREGLS